MKLEIPNEIFERCCDGCEVVITIHIDVKRKEHKVKIEVPKTLHVEVE